MKWIKDDIWNAWKYCGLLVVPSSSQLSSDGRLIMRRGILRDVLERFPGTDRLFGDMINSVCGSRGLFWYMRHPEVERIALLQTRLAYKSTLDLEVFAMSLNSVDALARYKADQDLGGYDPEFRIIMSKPAAGADYVLGDEIARHLSMLPDNVYVYTIGKIPII